MSQYIQNLIEEGEHQQLDFKYQVTDAKKIARTVSAFANTDGGRLLIGVKDNGRIAGIRSDEEYYMMELAAEIFCKPKVKFEAKTWNIRGKQVLEIIIQKKTYSEPITAPDTDGNYKAYVRYVDTNLVADEILHTVWKRKSRNQGAYIHYSKAEKKILDALESVSGQTLDELLHYTGLNKKVITDVLINFVLADIIMLQPDIGGSRFILNEGFDHDEYKDKNV
ncbi:MAG: helix-turn-helix domain-containing protein [Bacteroidales bacterium]